MFLRVLAACFLIFVSAAMPPARAAEVVVVLSDTGGAYAEYASAFQQFLEGSNWRVRWVGPAENLEVAPPADLLVTVGAEASRVALRRPGNTPVLATLLPRPAYERALAEVPGRPRHLTTAIFLDQPVARLLGLIRNLLPDRQRVGLLAGTETRPLLPEIRQAATAAGLSLEVEGVESDTSPVPAANHLLPRSDVLLALPDSSVYRRDHVRGILLASYRFQQPVIGFSQAMASSGAVAALYSTPAQIARQTVDLMKSLRPADMTLPPPQAPSLFVVSINQNVARSLGLKLSNESTIRQNLSADKGAR